MRVRVRVCVQVRVNYAGDMRLDRWLDAARLSPTGVLDEEDIEAMVRSCTALYCTVLYCTALYCTVLQSDWLEHCKRWEAIRDGIVRDNCYNNTEDVDLDNDFPRTKVADDPAAQAEAVKLEKEIRRLRDAINEDGKAVAAGDLPRAWTTPLSPAAEQGLG
jgi:hypothetical protein